MKKYTLFIILALCVHLFPQAQTIDDYNLLIVQGSQDGNAQGELQAMGHTVTILPASSLITSFDYSPYDAVIFMYNSPLAADMNHLLQENICNIGIIMMRGDATVDDMDLGASAYWVDAPFSIDNNSHWITQPWNTGLLDLSFVYKSDVTNPTANTTVLGSCSGSPSLVVHNIYKRVVSPYYGHTSGMPWSVDAGILMDRIIAWVVDGCTVLTQAIIPPSPYCAGDTVMIPFNTNITFNNGNVFTAELSDSLGDFANAVVIGSLIADTSDTIIAVIPIGVSSGYKYRIRVNGSSPAVTGVDNGTDLVISSVINITTQIDSMLLCNGDTNGQVASFATGGLGTLMYSIDDVNYQVGGTFNNLGANTYIIYVEDSNGCRNTDTIVLSEPTLLTVTTSTNDDLGNCNGDATANPSGGTSPYSYLWDANAGNQTTQTATGLCAGGYCVTITDNNGCTATACDSVDLFIGITEGTTAQHKLVFPNPTTGMVTVATQGNIEVFDVLGNMLRARLVGGLTEPAKRTIDLSGFPAGVYFISVKTINGTVTEKLLLTK